MAGIVVEFFGPPASGKSTLARETAEKLDREGFEVENPFYELAHEASDLERYVGKSIKVCRTLATSPAYSLRVVQEVYGTDQQTPTDLVKCTFNWLYLTGTIDSADDGITILDQGPIQALTSILLSGEADPDVEEMLPPVLDEPTEYVLVFVRAQEEILKDRLTERRENPSRVGSRYTLEDQLRIQATLLEEVTEILDSKGIRMVVVRNDRPSDRDRNVTTIFENVVGTAPDQVLQSALDTGR